MIPKNQTAEDFARYVATNKPYLIEIEDEIQKMGKFGEIEVRISIRGGLVDKVSFWKGRTWLRDRVSLTELPPSDNK